MYEDLYHRVMKNNDPFAKTRLPTDNTSTFDLYKDGWNQIQDKVDSEY